MVANSSKVSFVPSNIQFNRFLSEDMNLRIRLITHD